MSTLGAAHFHGGPMATVTGTLRQRRDLGPILGDSLGFYRQDWRGFVTIGAATIPISLASSAVQLSIEDELVRQLALLGLLLLSLVPLAIVEGAVVAYVDALDAGRKETEFAAFRRALGRAGPLASSVLRLAAVCVPLFVLIVGLPLGLFLLVRWILAPQAVMLDGRDGLGALRRSSELVTGHWWRTCGRMAAVSALMILLNLVVLSAVMTAPAGLYSLVSAIVGAFTTPYFSIALTLAYFDLKLRKDEEARVS